MSFTNIMELLGGLALFLYGMQMMSNGLEQTARNQMRDILKKITSNRVVGVLTGALITAVIQSSSATTVMVVGFVNSGIMTLEQATWIIMGANIGTTITGQLIALDVGTIAPLFAFIGVAAVVFQKNEKLKHLGEILAGLGVLFIGMNMMSSSMEPLANQPDFVNILTKVQNPVVGILMGIIFTAIIQSSSASVGILQALAASGVISLNSAAFILFGQNIGTCITALLASIGTNTNAKRTTLIHIIFNVFGTVIFTILCLVSPLISIMQHITPTSVPAQIANLHTLFNIVTTLLLLPVGSILPKIASFLLKEKKNIKQSENSMYIKYLIDPKNIHTETTMISVICIEGIRNELSRMTSMAKENVHDAFDIFINSDTKKLEAVEHREQYIDFLNKEISSYITNAITHEATKAGSQIFNSFYTITSNVERISDHAVNIAGYSKIIDNKNIIFSDNAYLEINEIKSVCAKTMGMLLSKPDNIIKWHEAIVCMEQKIDDMTIQFRNNMYNRIQYGTCSDESSILFSEMLTDFERIGDHALNISNEMLKITMKEIH